MYSQLKNDVIEWHGFYRDSNYLACYIYATKIALAGGNKNAVNNPFPSWQYHLDNMTSKVNTTGVAGVSWNNLLSDYNYSKQDKATKKKYRKYFIFGMAMHIATDVYAHSAFANGNLLMHFTNKEDNPNVAISRWSAAYGTAIDIAGHIKNNTCGDLKDFTRQHSCFDGSFYLGHILYYANGIGLSSYSNTVQSNLKKVSSGQFLDRIYTDDQIDGKAPY